MSVVLVVLVALAVVALVFGLVVLGLSAADRRARRTIALLDPDGLYDELPAAVDEDQDDVVTLEQVAELLPAGIVDDVQRALDGRPPVLQPELPDAYRVGPPPGSYSHVIVHPVEGQPYEL